MIILLFKLSFAKTCIFTETNSTGYSYNLERILPEDLLFSTNITLLESSLSPYERQNYPNLIEDSLAAIDEIPKWVEPYENPLTYRIIKNEFKPTLYSKSSNYRELAQSVQTAFEFWSSATSLNFYEVTNEEIADINISFQPKNHDCPFNFNGKDELAHAFFPGNRQDGESCSGDIHIRTDQEENFQWTYNIEDSFLQSKVKGHQKRNLFGVLIHEIGHSLGLGHANGITDSIMHPSFHNADWMEYVKKHMKRPELPIRDRSAIKRIYGEKKSFWVKKGKTVLIISLSFSVPVIILLIYYLLPSRWRNSLSGRSNAKTMGIEV